MFDFAPARAHRRPSLTPMIDVVFLLLIFFMLAAQFSRDTVLPLTAGAAGGSYQGPPRLVAIGAETLRLNGIETDLAALPGALAPLTASPEDTIVLRSDEDASLQRLVDVMQALREAGFENLALVE